MRKSCLSLFVGVAASLYSAAALGTVTVTGGTNPPTPALQGNGSYNITFGAGASGTFTINTTAGESLGAVTSVAGNDVTISTGSTPPASIGSITWTSGNGKFKIADVVAAGSIGTVSVHGIVTELKSTSGDLTGNITILNPGTTADINEIHFDGGTIRADIRNDYGGIVAISAGAAVGASAQNPVTISCRDTLGYYAKGSLNEFGSATNLRLGNLSWHPNMLIGTLTCDGNFTGEVNANMFDLIYGVYGVDAPALQIGGDFTGTMNLSGGLRGTVNAHNSGANDPCVPQRNAAPGDYFEGAQHFPLVWLGGSLTAGSTISLPAYTPGTTTPNCQSGGLEALLVVNANNNAYPGGRILGNVLVGGVPIDFQTGGGQTDGQFTSLPSALGYGSVSKLPLAIHGHASKLYLLSQTTPRTYRSFSEPTGSAPDTVINVPSVSYSEYLCWQGVFTGAVSSSDNKGTGGAPIHDPSEVNSFGLSNAEEIAFEYLIPQLVGGTYQCWQKPVTVAGPVRLMVW